MKRVAVLLLLLSLAIAVPAFARGSHSSGSHSRAARGVARNKHGRIKRSSAAKHAFERQHPVHVPERRAGGAPATLLTMFARSSAVERTCRATRRGRGLRRGGRRTGAS